MLAIAVAAFLSQTPDPKSWLRQRLPNLPETGWVQAEPEGRSPKLAGKVVYIVFATSGCYLCNVPMHLAKARDKQLRSKGFVGVVVMSGMTIRERDQKILERGLSCPVILDQSLALFKGMRCNGAPTTFLVDRKGVVRAVDLESSSPKEFETLISKLIAEPA